MTYEIKPRTLHFHEPAGTSRGTYTERRVWFVTLSEAGQKGTGECAPLPCLSCDDLPNYEEVLRRFCEQVCEKREIDREALRPYPSILFGLECALHMLRRGSRVLFDTPFTRGETGMPINGLIWMGTSEAMQRRLREKTKAGFHCIKVKIGAIDWEDEMNLLRQCRQLQHTGDTLRVDANGAFSPEEAPRRLKELAQLGIHSIEQPIRAGQWEAMGQLCATSPLPIALDEELIGVNDTGEKIRLLDTIRPQFIILKPSLHGGLTGCDEWVRLAEERGIGWWATSALESNVGLSAIAQWVSQYRPTLAQGLGTGLLYTDNTEAETEVIGEKIFFKAPNAPKDFKDFKDFKDPKDLKDSPGLAQFLARWRGDSATMSVQTSGSTGRPKQMEIEKERMCASARMTCDFLGLCPGQTALLCMSLDYIAGQMMVVRALERNLRLIVTPTGGHPLREIRETIDFAAMVPMQVWNSLQVPEEKERLKRIRHLIIGGGAISPELEEALRHFPNAVWSTYGMTETLSHIALQRISGPEASLWYAPLPGIRLSQDEETGCLLIDAPALNPERLQTHDIVEFAPDGRFRILGRTDNTISSGGVKIQLEEVESLLRRHLGDTVQATYRPDEKFGQALVLLSTRPIDRERLRSILSDHPYWMPKEVVLTPTLPCTETGKPDRATAQKMAMRG